MILVLAAMLQAVSASPPEKVDLTIPQPCQQSRAEDEVVVCAQGSGSPYRIREPEPQPSKPVKVELQLADGVNAGAETESVNVGGFPSNRVMLRLKLKF